MTQDPHSPDRPARRSFFEELPAAASFLHLAAPENYVPLPDDWIVVVTDIVTSRQEIENGRYKAVNMVGASIIAAIRNVANGVSFPFVFGGDGATLALPGDLEPEAQAVAASLQNWARDEFGITLRAGIMPVSGIRSAGFDVRVAKYAASDAVSYAAFAGGGVSWLEKRVKSGTLSVEISGAVPPPDLSGLSCRWSNLKAIKGNIVSMVLEPGAGAGPAEFSRIAEQVLNKIYETSGTLGPVPERGPGVQFPPPGMSLEARASRAGKSFVRRYFELFAENLLAWLFFRTGWSVGGFDPVHYARQTGRNTDHQKFEDGLKMTVDCDDATVSWIEECLTGHKAAGRIRYGLKVQSEALLTCIVPSARADDHIHFIDGAGGGYAAAASML